MLMLTENAFFPLLFNKANANVSHLLALIEAANWMLESAA